MNKIWTIRILNCLLPAGLIFFGAFTSGKITQEGVIAAIAASMLVAIKQFYDYCKIEEKGLNTPILFKLL